MYLLIFAGQMVIVKNCIYPCLFNVLLVQAGIYFSCETVREATSFSLIVLFKKTSNNRLKWFYCAILNPLQSEVSQV